MKEVVKFPINTPVEVTLQYQTGKPVEGRYGGQVMYSLLDNRVMYVPPYVEQRFQELAIGAGEPLVLCRRETTVGDRHRIEWSVRRAPQQAQPPLSTTLALDIPAPDAAHPPQAPACTADTAPPLRTEEGPQQVNRVAPLTHDPESTQVNRGTQPPVNGTQKQQEQPRANSTALMVQASGATKTHYQAHHSSPPPGTEVLPAPARPIELSAKDSVFLPAMSMEVALARRAAIVEFTRRIMVKDQDFGEIPGASKPTLLKPGAEKLCNFFGLEPEFTPIVEEIDWTGAQHGGEVFCYARYRCRLLRDGRVVGVGEGSCNSWEAKYRYRWVAEEQVPERLDRATLLKRGGRRTLCEFDFAIERGDPTGTYGKPAEHWQRFREAMAAGTARAVEKLTRRGKSVAWEIDVDATLYRIPNPDGADVVNTVQKMAQKRALVAAALIATSASEFFTQDIEDSEGGENGGLGTREAQEYVRDRKLEELRPKPPVSVELPAAGKPWKNFGEMRQVFAQLREQVGETRYREELELAGVENPGQFQTAAQALACYGRLARLAAQPEVA